LKKPPKLAMLVIMSKVQEIEAELQKLSPKEILQVRDWLENFLEDQLEFTEEFEAKIQQSEGDMAASTPSRTRRSTARR
jgi:hypothetical protein